MKQDNFEDFARSIELMNRIGKCMEMIEGRFKDKDITKTEILFLSQLLKKLVDFDEDNEKQGASL